MSKKNWPRHEFTVIVDDVREEAHGKLSLLGLYGNGIVVTPLPGSIPKICFFTRVIGGDEEHTITFSLIDPKGKDLIDKKEPMKISPKPEMVGNVNLTVTPFNIKEEGEYIFKIHINDQLFHTMPFNIKTSKSL